MDGDDDIQIIFDSRDKQAKKSHRERSSHRNEQEPATASNTSPEELPQVKMELIDVLDGDGDTSSVELLLEDSDTITSGDGKSVVDLSKSKPLSSSNDDLSGCVGEQPLAEENVEDLLSSSFEMNEELIIFQDDSINPPISSTSFGIAVQSSSARSAAEIWREACRSTMSTCSADSEYQSSLPFFTSSYTTKSVASSFVRGVDRMRLDDQSESREKTPLPVSFDEVSSTSDIVAKEVSEVERELALAAKWAENYDLRIDDCDEFLECEGEAAPSHLIEKDESVPNVRISAREPSKSKAAKPYRCRSHKRRNTSTSKAPEQESTTIREPLIEPENSESRRTTTENFRKRHSSPRHRVASRTQERKRFASDRSKEKGGKASTRSADVEPSTRSSRRRSAPTPIITSSAPKAQNLPRYKPAVRRYDFTRWLDSNGELVLHKISDVATGLVSAPLGCAYDTALDTFVFTRHDSILFASSDGRILDHLTIKGFDEPCAICVLQPGAAMGILDRSHLYLFEAKLKRLSIIASGLNARHRALTYTSNGDFATVKKYSSQLTVTIFDATSHNKIVGSYVFPTAEGLPAELERQPCFADSTGTQMFFTDLRTNTLTCMELAANRLEKVYSRCLQQTPTHRGEEALKRFIYMSGIRCDDSGHLLIADAKTRMLKLMTTSGQLLKCARFAAGATFPYCSAFAVSPSGMLMACDRANSRMILYRIGEETVSDDAVVTNDMFDRIIGQSGVENEVRRLKEKARRCL
ncbi:hypothetical protein Q1695_010638 [Nippostrongylus brasiliensis]|nr:hypothetical protein Q1695_010638 [Nippostrongylus brasiliensis]